MLFIDLAVKAKLAVMIQKQTIEELLKLQANERRRVLRVLQESLPNGDEEAPSTDGDRTSAAKWLFNGGTSQQHSSFDF